MIKKNLKSVLAIVLSVTTILTMTGCKSNQENKETKVEKVFSVGYAGFDGDFSPFSTKLQCDTEVADMTQLYLMTVDRSGNIIKDGIEGETTEYNDKEYTYYGPAKLDWSYNKEENTTTYKVKLRDDLTFSDGEPVTADDLIFSYYVYLDPSYVGTRVLNSFNIIGLVNYRMNSTAAEGIKIQSNDVKEHIKEPTKAMKRQIKKYMAKVLADEMKWCKTNYKAKGYESAVAMFLDYYNTDKNYKGTDEDQVVKDVLEQYGYDYKKLAVHYNGEEDYFDEGIEQLIYDELYKSAVKKAKGEEVPNIEGIKKVDDYTVQIKTKGFEASAVYSLFGIPITPMHYYGDVDKYDYAKNKFGFERGDVSSIMKKKEPLGAGAYIYKGFENGKVKFEANKSYYLGAPKIKNIEFKTVKEQNMIPMLDRGELDCAEGAGSVGVLDEVKELNTNRELTGDIISTIAVDSMLYGYVGINADRVCVNSRPASEKSKALRKGLLTLFSVYRNESVADYYADAATVLDYPIQKESWASPQSTDEGYQEAFSVDVNGEKMYEKDMSKELKEEKALEAAKDYFIKAGYIFDENKGKFTDAPFGAKLSYTVYVPAEGVGDHPIYGILTKTKKALKELGIDLKIKDVKNDSKMWDKIDEGKVDIWCAAWETDVDPDMYQKYHSNNIIGKDGSSNQNLYRIKDKNLDALLLSARKSEDQDFRKIIYKECMDIVLQWGVELPVYQRLNCTIFSTQRVNTDSLPKDTTGCYDWMKEIHKLELN